MDPLADQYAPWSPYNYVLGNPIIFIDSNGMRIIIGGQEWKAGDKYNGESDSFGARMLDRLNNIASNSESGVAWLNELKSADFDFNIKLDNQSVNGFDPDNKPEWCYHWFNYS